jgi:hypothetical protein
MSNRSNVRSTQANQPQGMVPLTPEVAREIENLLDKNAEALENLMVRHNAGRGTKEIQHQQRAAQFSSN